jgi:hypothetical protein
VFQQTFPNPFAYEPYWNGGRISNATAASGGYLPGLFLVPLARLTGLSIDTLYTPLIAFHFLLLAPALAYASLRWVGGGRIAGLLAAHLAVCAHSDLIRYLLHFGTLGWSFGVPFILPGIALLHRLVAGDLRLRCWLGFALCAGTVMVWPVHGVLALAWLPALLFGLPLRDRRVWTRGLSSLALLALWFGPVAWGLYKLTDISTFVKKGVVVERAEPTLSQGLASFWEGMLAMHPLVLVFGVAGILLMRKDRTLRLAAGPAMLLIPLIMLAGPWFSQSLEWHRLVVALACVAVLPAALLLENLLKPRTEPQPGFSLNPGAALAACALGVVLLGIPNLRRYFEGRTLLPFTPRKEEIGLLADWIRNNTRPGERVLFSGYSGHAYGGGHVAIFPVLTGREMVGADYFHFSPKLVEYFMPPRFYRTKPEDVFHYMKLFNAHWVVIWQGGVKKHYDAHPEWYEKVAEIKSPIPKHVYRVKHEGTMFVEGGGTVSASTKGIVFEPADASQESVIRYNWSDRFRVDPPATIEPAPMDERTTFIRVKPGGVRRVVIR